jgi:hypothetical protein
MPVIGAYHCLTSQPIVGSYRYHQGVGPHPRLRIKKESHPWQAWLSFFSLYSKLRTSPLDTGPEQEYTCSIRRLNEEGESLGSPPGSTD